MSVIDTIFPGRAQDRALKQKVEEERRKTQDIGKEAKAVLAAIRAKVDAEATKKKDEEDL